MQKIIHSFRISGIELITEIVKASDCAFNQMLNGLTGLFRIENPDIILHKLSHTYR
jgi:hypothetical protein